ncbi:uncharacterized protein LOC127248348 [Andrographis paniculata]|uniref:uncharacterized protein LOC127248348 n=1 Tax=Andrographis paniculata TaxID=175694 RepID=UPI0021E8E6C3|nr:uncharacterized protein LOC127248348 [Andrographis paniculata]
MDKDKSKVVDKKDEVAKFKGKEFGQRKKKIVICYKCHKQGQYAGQCPNKRTVMILENGEWEYVNDGEGDEVVEAEAEAGSDDEIEELSQEAEHFRHSTRDCRRDAEHLHRTMRDVLKSKGVAVTILAKPSEGDDGKLLLSLKEFNKEVRQINNQYEGNLLKEFEDIFLDDIPHKLPPLRGIEHLVDFAPGALIPNRPAYMCNPNESEETHRQVQELLDKGWVRESLSPCVVPILLVPKKDNSGRMCVDCKSVNVINVKYQHPIEGLDDMPDELHGARLFTKIDLTSGYHQIRMQPGDEWKIAFKTKFGLYEWLVMPFSTCLEDYLQHVSQVFHALRNAKLYGSDGLKVYEAKKNVPFKWESSHEAAFEKLRDSLTHAPVLALPDFERAFEVQCDASGVGITSGEEYFEAPWFSKMAHFKPCAKMVDVNHVAKRFFREVVKLHVVSKTVVSDQDVKHVSTTTKLSPFEVVYGFNPLTPTDILPLPSTEHLNFSGRDRATAIKELHAKVWENIDKAAATYGHYANREENA